METKEFDFCFFKYLIIHDLIEYLAYFTDEIIYLILKKQFEGWIWFSILNIILFIYQMYEFLE